MTFSLIPWKHLSFSVTHQEDILHHQTSFFSLLWLLSTGLFDIEEVLYIGKQVRSPMFQDYVLALVSEFLPTRRVGEADSRVPTRCGKLFLSGSRNEAQGRESPWL